MEQNKYDIIKSKEIISACQKHGVDISAMISYAKEQYGIMNEAIEGNNFSRNIMGMKIDERTKNILMAYSVLNPTNSDSADRREDFKKFLCNNYINHYVSNESIVEGVDLSHGANELKGLAEMYRYIYSPEVDERKNNHIILILQNLRKQLFRFSEYSEFAGEFRKCDAYIPGFSAELSSPGSIVPDLIKIDPEYQQLKKEAEECRLVNDPGRKIEFIKKTIIFQYYLLKIHPFSDGNGRTIRGLTNLLFEKAGIVPTYVNSEEKVFYKSLFEPINKKIEDGIELEDTDFIDLHNFYEKKVCDSIMDVVVSPFSIALEEMNEEKKLKLAPPKSNLRNVFEIEDKKGQ